MLDRPETDHDRPIAIDLHIAYMHAREGASSPPPSVVVGTARTQNVTFARSSVAVAEIGRGEDLRRSGQTMEKVASIWCARTCKVFFSGWRTCGGALRWGVF